MGPRSWRIALTDCLVEVKEGSTAQLWAGDSPERYVYISKILAYKPSQDSQGRFLKFFVTRVAGGADGLNAELAIGPLAIRGLRLPRRIVIYYGSGGDQKVGGPDSAIEHSGSRTSG